MKIVKKENLAKELKQAVESLEVFEGVGKDSGKPYSCFKVKGKNGKEIMYFPSTQDLLRLGLVIDDEPTQTTK